MWLKRLLQITIATLLTYTMFYGQTDWSAPLQNCWTYQFASDARLFASDNDNIFILSSDSLIAVSNQGQFLWRLPLQETNQVGLQTVEKHLLKLSYPIPGASPNQLTIQNYSPQTGLLIWTQLLKTEFDPQNPPSLSSSQGQLIVLNQNELHHLDLSTGAALNNLTLTPEKPRKSLIIGTNAVLLLESTNLGIFSLSDGSLAKNIEPPPDTTSFETFESNTLFSDAKGHIFSFTSTKKNWSRKLGAQVSASKYINNGLIIASNDNYLYRFSIKEGDLIWKKRFPNRISLIYSPENNLLFLGNDAENNIEIIDPQNGKVINQILIPEKTLSLPHRLLVQNKLLLVLGAGNIQAFSPKNCQ